MELGKGSTNAACAKGPTDIKSVGRRGYRECWQTGSSSPEENMRQSCGVVTVASCACSVRPMPTAGPQAASRTIQSLDRPAHNHGCQLFGEIKFCLSCFLCRRSSLRRCWYLPDRQGHGAVWWILVAGPRINGPCQMDFVCRRVSALPPLLDRKY